MDTVLSYGDSKLLERDVQLLAGPCWLNDQARTQSELVRERTSLVAALPFPGRWPFAQLRRRRGERSHQAGFPHPPHAVDRLLL
jgi:hypothetical protein